MARYIDADDFRKTMIKRFGCVPCLTDYSTASRNDIHIDDALNLVPTTDIVPKSEVEKIIGTFDTWLYKHYNGDISDWDLYKLFAELKKKYL